MSALGLAVAAAGGLLVTYFMPDGQDDARLMFMTLGPIFADPVTGKQRWDSHFLRGNERAKATGELSGAKAKQDILVTDYAHEGRPPGADPFDIRDEVLWLRPLVRLGRSGQAGRERW